MDRCMEIKKDFVIIRNDCNYRIICNCIVVHKEAIRLVVQAAGSLLLSYECST